MRTHSITTLPSSASVLLVCTLPNRSEAGVGSDGVDADIQPQLRHTTSTLTEEDDTSQPQAQSQFIPGSDQALSSDLTRARHLPQSLDSHA